MYYNLFLTWSKGYNESYAAAVKHKKVSLPAQVHMEINADQSNVGKGVKAGLVVGKTDESSCADP